MSMSEKMAIAIEIVARENAENIGFNINTERHGLMRAMAMVLSDKTLLMKSVDKIKDDGFIEEALKLGIPVPDELKNPEQL